MAQWREHNYFLFLSPLNNSSRRSSVTISDAMLGMSRARVCGLYSSFVSDSTHFWGVWEKKDLNSQIMNCIVSQPNRLKTRRALHLTKWASSITKGVYHIRSFAPLPTYCQFPVPKIKAWSCCVNKAALVDAAIKKRPPGTGFINIV